MRESEGADGSIHHEDEQPKKGRNFGAGRFLGDSDGSTDVYFGPTAPEGHEANWVQTNPGKGWFSYFRFYGPTEAFFDKSWALPDFEKIN